MQCWRSELTLNASTLWARTLTAWRRWASWLARCWKSTMLGSKLSATITNLAKTKTQLWFGSCWIIWKIMKSSHAQFSSKLVSKYFSLPGRWTWKGTRTHRRFPSQHSSLLACKSVGLLRSTTTSFSIRWWWRRGGKRLIILTGDGVCTKSRLPNNSWHSVWPLLFTHHVPSTGLIMVRPTSCSKTTSQLFA